MNWNQAYWKSLNDSALEMSMDNSIVPFSPGKENYSDDSILNISREQISNNQFVKCPQTNTSTPMSSNRSNIIIQSTSSPRMENRKRKCDEMEKQEENEIDNSSKKFRNDEEDDFLYKKLNRTKFSDKQKKELIEAYKQNSYPDPQETKELSDKLEVTESTIKIWFQNRRAREKKKMNSKKVPTFLEILRNVPMGVELQIPPPLPDYSTNYSYPFPSSVNPPSYAPLNYNSNQSSSPTASSEQLAMLYNNSLQYLQQMYFLQQQQQQQQ
ncbi:hypothetical protein SNEBB_010697 [Seison nebaliae]|nr:hypothetical protein SNEBB_010697 [Seison nebaliae]